MPTVIMTQKHSIKVKVKKLHPDAKIPFYATDGSAGMDITFIKGEAYRTEDGIVHADKVKYYTGLAFEIPKGYVMLIFPRSSIAKKDISLTNCVGVIDSDYRGEVTAVFRKHQVTNKMYNNGERGCQAIVIPYPKVIFEEVEELSETERGDGGYGSTCR